MLLPKVGSYTKLPNHICQLQWALYELKQAPRVWFNRFSSFLIDYGFKYGLFDSSLFVFHNSVKIFLLNVYVDDIILIGNTTLLLNDFIEEVGA